MSDQAGKSPGEAVTRALSLYEQIAQLDAAEPRSTDGEQLFDQSRENLTATLKDTIVQSGTAHLFLAEIGVANAFAETAEEVRTTILPQAVLMGRIALEFLTKPSEEDDNIPTNRLPDMLLGDSATVAERLQGKHLQVGSKILIIAEVTPQAATENAKWIKEGRPLFTADPAAAYSVRTRGPHVMLFLRSSESGSCVRIVSGRDQLTGVNYTNPSQVCAFFGLAPNTTYSVDADNTTLSLTDPTAWSPPSASEAR